MSLETKLKKVLRTVEKALGPRRKGNKLTPLETAIHAILSPYNSSDQVRKAVLAVQRDFVDWNEVRVASWKEIGNIFEKTGLKEAGAKAFALKKALLEIFNRYNKISLAPLLAAKPEEARKAFVAMREFPEWGAGAVLALNLGVDGLHITPSLLRISKRIGLIRDDSLAKGRKELERRVPRKDHFRYQQHLSYLAASVCLVEVTLCDRCPLNKVCTAGIEKIRLERQSEKPARKAKKTAKKTASKTKPAPKKKTAKKTAPKKKTPKRTGAKPAPSKAKKKKK